MAIEIERKYLVVDNSWRGLAEAGQRLRQAYILVDGNGSARIRITDAGARLTLKFGHAVLAREEFEYPITLTDAEDLLEHREGNIIDKTRYPLHYRDKLWEIYEFHGVLNGLVMAEVELQSEHEIAPTPPWVGAEVTGQAAYYNLTLAIQGKPPDHS